MKLMRIGIQVVLVAIIAFLVYQVWESVQQPLRFRAELERRDKQIISKLKAIREAELAYEKKYGTYTANYDSLIYFVKNGQMSVVKKEGTAPDTLSEYDAWKRGIIKRDTVWVSVYEGKFKKDFPKLNIDSLHLLPFLTDKSITLSVDSIVTETGSIYPVFEAKIPLEHYLDGLERQEIINLKAEKERLERYPGLKVGSLEEVSKAGNWE